MVYQNPPPPPRPPPTCFGLLRLPVQGSGLRFLLVVEVYTAGWRAKFFFRHQDCTGDLSPKREIMPARPTSNQAPNPKP